MDFPSALSTHYQILQQIGAGGMGVVYLAKDRSLERLLAIKVILRGLSASKVAIKRFYREVEISARLDHPNIVKVYQVGMAASVPYLVMEYVPGLPLHEYCRQKQPDLDEKLAIIAKVATAVDYAHRQKIIHRDIKPANILVREDGEPVLMDFGIAKTTQVADRSLTQSGEVIGTPNYMAPEQAQGQRRAIDHRIDIYALGAVLYQTLTGSPPIQADSFMEAIYILARRESLTLPSSLVPGIPQALDAICLRSLAYDRNQRYPRAKNFAEDISRYRRKTRPNAAIFLQKQRRQKLGLLLLGAIVIIIVTLIAGKWLSGWYHQQQIMAQVDCDYQTGHDKLSVYPEMAAMYFERAKSLLETSLPHREGQNFEIRAWHQKLKLALLTSYFYSRNWQQFHRLCPEAGKQKLPTEIKWLKAMAAYHENKQKLALKLLPDFFHATPRRQKISRYYFANIKYGNSNLVQASKYYQRMLLATKVKDDVDPLIQLKFCASNLLHFENEVLKQNCVKVEAVLTPANLAQIGNYLKEIEKTLADKPIIGEMLETRSDSFWQKQQIVYRATRARYLLAWKELKSGPELDSPEQISKSLRNYLDDERLFITDAQKADYLFLRAKVNQLLGNPSKSKNDIDHAYKLRPQLYLLLELWKLLGSCALPHEFQQDIDYYFLQFDCQFAITPDIFRNQARQLRDHCLELSLKNTRESNFDESALKKFCQLLQTASSSRIRELVVTAISSMRRHDLVITICRKQINDPALRRQLESALSQYQQRREQIKSLQKLSLIPWQGKIAAATLKEFAGKNAFLSELMHGRPKSLLPASKTAALLLRYLAARLLVQIADSSTCQRLYHQTISDPQEKISTKIMLVRAWHECGVTYFYDHSFWRDLIKPIATPAAAGNHRRHSKLSPENEFLQSLLAPFIAPEEALSWSLSQQAMLLLISNLSPDAYEPQLLEKFVAILEAGQQQLSPDLQALSIRTLWNQQWYDSYFKQDQRRIARYFPLLKKALATDAPEIVQLAAMESLNRWETRHAYRTDELVAMVRKIIKQQPTLAIRLQCLIALVSMVDNQTVSRVYTAEYSVLEKIAIFVGIMRSHNHHFQQHFLSSQLLVKRQSRSKEVRALVWYITAFFFKLYDRPHPPADIHPILLKSARRMVWQQLHEGMQSRDNFLRFFASMGMILLKSEPGAELDQLLLLLQQRWQEEPQLNIRAAAFGTLIYLACKHNLWQQLRDWQQWAMDNNDQRQAFLWATFWGYHQIIKDNSVCPITQISEMNYDRLQLDHYELNQLLQAPAKPRSKFIACLTAIRKILAALGEADGRYRYIQALLMQRSKVAPKQILDLCRPALARCHDQNDAKLVALWADVRRQQLSAASQKARKDVQKIAEKLEEINCRQGRGWAAIWRALGEVYLHLKLHKQARRCFESQYWLAPRDPEALTALGMYYYHRRQLQQALTIFRHASHRFPRYGRVYFETAKTLVRLQAHPRKIIDMLDRAKKTGYLVSHNQLDDEPLLNELSRRIFPRRK